MSLHADWSSAYVVNVRTHFCDDVGQEVELEEKSVYWACETLLVLSVVDDIGRYETCSRLVTSGRRRYVIT
jgi:hypothetical protein